MYTIYFDFHSKARMWFCFYTHFADEKIEVQVTQLYPLTLKSPAGFVIWPLHRALSVRKAEWEKRHLLSFLCVRSATHLISHAWLGALGALFSRKFWAWSPWIGLQVCLLSIHQFSMPLYLLPSFHHIFLYCVGGREKNCNSWVDSVLWLELWPMEPMCNILERVSTTFADSQKSPEPPQIENCCRERKQE